MFDASLAGELSRELDNLSFTALLFGENL